MGSHLWMHSTRRGQSFAVASTYSHLQLFSSSAFPPWITPKHLLMGGLPPSTDLCGHTGLTAPQRSVPPHPPALKTTLYFHPEPPPLCKGGDSAITTSLRRAPSPPGPLSSPHGCTHTPVPNSALPGCCHSCSQSNGTAQLGPRHCPGDAAREEVAMGRGWVWDAQRSPPHCSTTQLCFPLSSYFIHNKIKAQTVETAAEQHILSK